MNPRIRIFSAADGFGVDANASGGFQPGENGSSMSEMTSTIRRSETLVFSEASFTDPNPLPGPKVFYRVRLEP